ALATALALATPHGSVGSAVHETVGVTRRMAPWTFAAPASADRLVMPASCAVFTTIRVCGVARPCRSTLMVAALSGGTVGQAAGGSSTASPRSAYGPPTPL